jgi:DNA-binding protein YbaB
MVGFVTVFHDPDEALAKVQRDILSAQERAARATEVRSRIDAVRGVGRSPRGEVVVEVDSSGMLRDVTLTDAAMDLRSKDLADLIVDAARVAQRDAGRQTVALAEDAFGQASPMVEHLRSEVQRRYVV